MEFVSPEEKERIEKFSEQHFSIQRENLDTELLEQPMRHMQIGMMWASNLAQYEEMLSKKTGEKDSLKEFIADAEATLTMNMASVIDPVTNKKQYTDKQILSAVKGDPGILSMKKKLRELENDANIIAMKQSERILKQALDASEQRLTVLAVLGAKQKREIGQIGFSV